MMFTLVLNAQIDLNEWAIIFTSRDSRVTNQFLETLRDVGRKIGMYIGKPQSVPIPSDQTKNYCEQIKRLYNGKVQIIVMIFPTNRDDRYASVKKLCNSDLGIASQVSFLFFFCIFFFFKNFLFRFIVNFNFSVNCIFLL